MQNDALCPPPQMHWFCQSEALYLEKSSIKNNSKGESQKRVRKTFYAYEKQRYVKDKNHKTGYNVGDLPKYLIYDFQVEGQVQVQPTSHSSDLSSHDMYRDRYRYKYKYIYIHTHIDK